MDESNSGRPTNTLIASTVSNLLQQHQPKILWATGALSISYLSLFYIPRLFSYQYNELTQFAGYEQIPLHLRSKSYKYKDHEKYLSESSQDNSESVNCPFPENRLWYQFNKEEIRFPVNNNPNLTCVADFYIPILNENNTSSSISPSTTTTAATRQTTRKKRPIVIMCHGIGATRDMSFWKYAMILSSVYKYFVIDFDYLTFGESDGIIRNIVNPNQHINDIIGCIQYIATTLGKDEEYSNIDISKIILFGASFGAAHALCSIAKLRKIQNENTNIKCMIGLVPFIGVIPENEVKKYQVSNVGDVDGDNSKQDHKHGNSEVNKRTFSQLFFGFYGGISDLLLGLIGSKSALYGKFYGYAKDKDLSLFYYEDVNLTPEKIKQQRLKKFRGNVRDGCALRSIFSMVKYHPAKILDQVNVPVFFVYSDKDRMASSFKVKYAIDVINKANNDSKFCQSYQLNDCEHHDINTWKYVPNIAQDIATFINKNCV